MVPPIVQGPAGLAMRAPTLAQGLAMWARMPAQGLDMVAPSQAQDLATRGLWDAKRS